MDSNYFNSKKYIILLVIICFLFVILTVKVFDYMPQPPDTQEYEGYTPSGNIERMSSYNTNNYQSSQKINEDNNDDEDNDDDDSAEDNEDNEQNKAGHIDFMQSSSVYPDFEEIPAPKGAVEEEINADGSAPAND